ncbi:MAG: RagB/SusD family nutrient uptake outer membrane protein [Ilumatobacteraceae bacterium]
MQRKLFIGWLLLFSLLVFSCKKSTLNNVTYGTFGESFPSNANEALAAVNYCYTGMVQETMWSLNWNYLRPEDLASTNELYVNWGWDGLRSFTYFTPDNFLMTESHYSYYVRLVSQITVYIDKITNLSSLDAATRNRYLGELKGLRGYYNAILFSHYGPVPVRMKAAEVDNPAVPYIPRPSSDTMVNYIVSDLSDAIAVLPDKFTGDDYGRFSKAAALTCRMKLYMNQKRWSDAMADGEAIQQLGYSLMPNYNDNFGPEAKGGNAEIILPIVCSPTGGTSGEYANLWFAYCLPGDYQDPSGTALAAWNGWRMPWSTYRKFDTVNDQRTLRLLRYYPCSARGNGQVVWRDAWTGDTAASLTGGKVTAAGTLNGGAVMMGRGHFSSGDAGGAIPMKFDVDHSGQNSEQMDMDFVVYRYADVLLLLAEAYNNSGRTSDAITLINQIRTRAGLANTTAADQVSVQTALENERLFELWFEFNRREDLIRWGKYIQRAIDDGSYLLNANWNSGSAGPQKYLLYPIPRTVISKSNGIVTQNPGYE